MTLDGIASFRHSEETLTILFHLVGAECEQVPLWLLIDRRCRLVLREDSTWCHQRLVGMYFVHHNRCRIGSMEILELRHESLALRRRIFALMSFKELQREQFVGLG